jgi:hypothetical protein
MDGEKVSVEELETGGITMDNDELKVGSVVQLRALGGRQMVVRELREPKPPSEERFALCLFWQSTDGGLFGRTSEHLTSLEIPVACLERVAAKDVSPATAP